MTHIKVPKTVRGAAMFWKLSDRQIIRLRRDGVNVFDVDEMLERSLLLRSKTNHFYRCMELENLIRPHKAEPGADSDWVEFWRDRVQKALNAGTCPPDLAQRLFAKLDKGITPTGELRRTTP
jgi:nitric oxide synthase oxygenase domain/subunit